jgi:hypothetical protein
VDKSSKYYIAANMWLIATLAVILAGQPYAAVGCAIGAVANFVGYLAIIWSDKP